MKWKSRLGFEAAEWGKAETPLKDWYHGGQWWSRVGEWHDVIASEPEADRTVVWRLNDTVQEYSGLREDVGPVENSSWDIPRWYSRKRVARKLEPLAKPSLFALLSLSRISMDLLRGQTGASQNVTDYLLHGWAAGASPSVLRGNTTNRGIQFSASPVGHGLLLIPIYELLSCEI